MAPPQKTNECERCIVEFFQIVFGCLCVFVVIFIVIVAITTMVYSMTYYQGFLRYFFESIKQEALQNLTSFVPNVHATTPRPLWSV